MPCNLCGGTQFATHRGKPREICVSCGAKARHRVALAVYERHLYPLIQRNPGPVLHLAPEKALSAVLSERVGSNYCPVDASPERYPHVQCMKMFFPDDFHAIADHTYMAILHNHVLEHIPGHFGDHLREFARILAPGGRMIFSVPGPYLDRKSEEGGEHLFSDQERLDRFLQEDHLKVLGYDFVEFIERMPGGMRIPDGITDKIRAELSVRPGKAPFFVWEKDA